MRGKKFLSLLLSLVVILSLTVTPTLAATAETVTVYFNVSRYGEFIKDKSNNAVVLAPVKLTGKETYTLDDAFKALHDTYYEGGSEAGYISAVGKYGLYIIQLWGDESGNFGYMYYTSYLKVHQHIENPHILETIYYTFNSS